MKAREHTPDYVLAYDNDRESSNNNNNNNNNKSDTEKKECVTLILAQLNEAYPSNLPKLGYQKSKSPAL